MSEEDIIKAIDEGLKTLQEEPSETQLAFEQGCKYTFQWILRYCDNLQQERDFYKEVIEKANSELITLIQIIMEQPSKNVEEDNYLLSRLESISNILVGGNNE